MRTPGSTEGQAHLIERIARQVIREEVRRATGLGPLNGRGIADRPGISNFFHSALGGGSGSILSGSSGGGSGGVFSSESVSPISAMGEDGDLIFAGGGVSPAGVDYGNWPLASTEFTSANARLSNLDYYVGTRFVTAMRGGAADGGHQHSGVNGDAPPIPVQNVLMADGTRLADFLGTEYVTSSATGGPTGDGPSYPQNLPRYAVFDDFEVADQAMRWQTLYGTPERVSEANGNYRWKLPPGTLIRLRTPGFSFTDRISLRMDLKFDLGVNQRTLDVRVRARLGTSGYGYVVGLSATHSCYIGELDYSTGIVNLLSPLEADFQIPNDSYVRTVEVMLNGTLLQAGTEDGDQMAATLSRDDSADEGYVELYVPPDGEAVFIDNFLIVRSSLGLVQPHGSTHYENGADPLDVKDLADSLGLLGGAGSVGNHATSHYATGADPLDINYLPDAFNRLLTTAEKAALTEGGLADSYHTHGNLTLLEYADTPAPVSRTGAAGVSTSGAAADHAHAQPHWRVETYVDDAIGSGHLPVDTDFNGLVPVRVTYLPTVGGEFTWHSYGNGQVFRARLGIRNNGEDDREITLLVPAIVGVIFRLRKVNTEGDALLQTWTEDDTLLNAEETINLPAGETTTLILYGSSVGDTAHYVAVQNTESDGDLFAESKDLAWVAA